MAEYKHSGPLPDPGTLNSYGRVDPSFPERIVRMAEIQVEAQVDATKRLSKADALSTTLGALTVPTINAACVVLAGIGVFRGHWEALTAMVVPAASALVAMLRRAPKDEG